MAELKFDWSACIVSGGAELISRVEAARAEYSSVCSEYFDYLVSKAGKPAYTATVSKKAPAASCCWTIS